MLAASSDEAVERHIADGLTRFTETSIVDPGLLRAELTEIRLRGYATNAGEWRTDVSAVAAAVLGDAGLPVASISVNVPTSRMTEDSRAAFGAALREAAKTVSEALKRTRGD